MWRITLALTSALALTMALALTVAADSHTTQPQLPATGHGTAAGSGSDGMLLVLALVGLAGLLALAALRQLRRA